MGDMTKERIAELEAICADLQSWKGKQECSNCYGTGIMEAVIGTKQDGPNGHIEITDDGPCPACDATGKDPWHMAITSLSGLLAHVRKLESDKKELERALDIGDGDHMSLANDRGWGTIEGQAKEEWTWKARREMDGK